MVKRSTTERMRAPCIASTADGLRSPGLTDVDALHPYMGNTYSLYPKQSGIQLYFMYPKRCHSPPALYENACAKYTGGRGNRRLSGGARYFNGWKSSVQSTLGTLGCNLTPYDRDLTRKDALRPPSAGVAGSAALSGKLPEAAVQGRACTVRAGQGGPGGVLCS